MKTHQYAKPGQLLACMLLFMALLGSCKDDADEVPAFALVSMKAGTVELQEGSITTGVPVDATFEAIFNRDLSGPILMYGSGCVSMYKGHGESGEEVELLYGGEGTSVTVYPIEGDNLNRLALESNTAYTLRINCITSVDGQTLPVQRRSFTTQ